LSLDVLNGTGRREIILIRLQFIFNENGLRMLL
jgi:hypothetical protein